MTVYANNVAGVVAAGIGPTDTIVVLNAGQGALFPSVPVGDYFFATLIHPITFAVEIVKCTARAGDSLTVERGRDGTTAIAFPSSTIIEMRLTAEMMREVNWRNVGNAAGGVPILDPGGRVAASQLPVTIPYTVGGAVPLEQLPPILLTETEGDARYGRLDQAEVWAENQTFNKAVTVLGRLQVGGGTGELGVGDDATLRDVGRQNTMGVVGGQDPTQGALQFGVGGGVLQWNKGTGNFDIYPSAGGQYGVYHAGNFNADTKVNVIGGQASSLRNYRVGVGSEQGLIYFGAANNYILFDGFNFTISNNVYAPNLIGTSDERLKKRIRGHRTPKKIGDQVKLVSWEWRKSLMDGAPAGRWTGPMAQAVQKFAPWHVTKGPDGWLGVDKAGLALEVSVDNTDRIRKLESEVVALHALVTSLLKNR